MREFGTKIVGDASRRIAVNVETHLKRVWGRFQNFKSVNMPSVLPGTG
jgi:hypothetical protein